MKFSICRSLAILGITGLLYADMRQQFIDHMDKAKASIDVVVYEIRSGDIADALIAAKRRGVRVRVMVDSVRSPVATPQEKMLEEEDIPVKRVAGVGRKLLHDKFILFDGALAATPSYNRSAKSLSVEEEEGFTHDKALIQKLQSEFNDFWATSDQDASPDPSN